MSQPISPSVCLGTLRVFQDDPRAHTIQHSQGGQQHQRVVLGALAHTAGAPDVSRGLYMHLFCFACSVWSVACGVGFGAPAGRAQPARTPSARAHAQAEHGPAALPAGLGVRGRSGRGGAPGRARAAARGARAAPGAAGGVRPHGARAGRHGAGAGAPRAPPAPGPRRRLRGTAGSRGAGRARRAA